jgi:hypothetical protein
MEKLKGREFQMEGITCSHNPTTNSYRITVFNCITGEVVEERSLSRDIFNKELRLGVWLRR